jgi:hypothetical protein
VSSLASAAAFVDDGWSEQDAADRLCLDVDELRAYLTGRDAGRALAPPDAAQEPIEPDSWIPLDLGPYLRGEVRRPEPTVGVARRDGVKFLYPGKEHAVIGEMEAGKSWFALACVAAELSMGRTVVYVTSRRPTRPTRSSGCRRWASADR